MATCDLDSEQLISRFCGALSPADRGDFRRAAEGALAAIPCAGEGACYCALRDLFEKFFRPPFETNHPIGIGSRRPSKLTDGPPIGAPDPREGARDRHRLRAAVE
jgi:hypothetical protein